MMKKSLTPRELEVVQLIASGFTDREIAAMLSISSKTVNTHRKNVLKKLAVKNTALLIRYVIENRLVS
jgi:DNA-binding CsgD family transcriptional regulator